MKAAILTGPEEIRIVEQVDPAAPADGLVLEVKTCGVCGSDVRRWKEGPPPGSGGVTPGHEAAGVVVEVGEATAGFAVGDCLAIAPDVHCGECWYCRHERFNLCDNLRLIGITPGYPGGFAERLVLTSEILTNGIVHLMADCMSFIDAALAEPASSVIACHDASQTGPDDTVVVLGAGPIGCLHIVVAQARGARAIVSECSNTRRVMAERFSPEAVIDASTEDVVARVCDLTDGLGADLVVCANAVAETQTQAVEMVRKGGRVVLFGGLPKAAPMVSVNANRIHYGEIELVGSFSYHPDVHAKALDLIARGKIPAERLISHTFPLAGIDRAFATAASGDCLKIVITLSEDAE